MRYLRLCTITLGLVLVATHASADDGLTGLGHWITETGNYEVDIAPCGPALCGTIVRVLGNRSMIDPGVEMTSPDPRPALGMQILTDLVPAGEHAWTGSIYNRENAKTYSCVVTLLNPGELRVRGYVGLPIFGRTSIWHRP
jgi:uncharacterized protein (DUF2147 family)